MRDMEAPTTPDLPLFVSARTRSTEENWTLTADQEASLICKALHARTRQEFREAIDMFLTHEERHLIGLAEELSLLWQAVRVFDEVVKRLTLRFAEIIAWPQRFLVPVIEPRKELRHNLACIVLDISSRGLSGPVAFRISELWAIPDRFPSAALDLLAQDAQLLATERLS